jgi:hypothetical protein
MREILSEGEWDEGRTMIEITDESNAISVEGFDSDNLFYEFWSENESRPDSPRIGFTPSELRTIIRRAESELGEDTFNEPNFERIREWFQDNEAGTVAEIGDSEGHRKQFKIDENPKTGTPYLKIQRFTEANGNHQTLPTMGRKEFTEVFETVKIL